jgi:hypothetical protein
MLKTMQIYQKCIFWVFIVFCYFCFFFWKFIKNMGQKLGSNKCPLFTMFTKQKFLNVLHSKLVKKTKRSHWLTEWSTQPRTLLFKRKWSHYLGWPTPFEEKWSIFTGDLPTHSHWSIFTGNLPTHTHCGLFSRATCPHTLTLVYFHGRPTDTYSLWSISRGDHPHTLTLVYFHRRPAHTYSRWSIFRGDLPMHTHTGLFLRATYPFDWVNLRSHLAISFNQNQNRGIARST